MSVVQRCLQFWINEHLLVLLEASVLAMARIWVNPETPIRLVLLLARMLGAYQVTSLPIIMLIWWCIVSTKLVLFHALVCGSICTAVPWFFISPNRFPRFACLICHLAFNAFCGISLLWNAFHRNHSCSTVDRADSKRADPCNLCQYEHQAL